MKINKMTKALVLCLGILGLSSCTYDGAVYTQYRHLGIELKAEPNRGIPVKINIGEDHGMLAMPPKLQKTGGESGEYFGEVGSLIAKDEVEAHPQITSTSLEDLSKYATRKDWRDFVHFLDGVLPQPEGGGDAGDGEGADGQPTAKELGARIAKVSDKGLQKDIRNAISRMAAATAMQDAGEQEDTAERLSHFNTGQNLLRARSYIVSGTAAVVASLPDNYALAIDNSNTVGRVGGDDDNNGGKDHYIIVPKGKAKDRIGEAMTGGMSGFLTPSQLKLADIFHILEKRDKDEQEFVRQYLFIHDKYKKLKEKFKEVTDSRKRAPGDPVPTEPALLRVAIRKVIKEYPDFEDEVQAYYAGLVKEGLELTGDQE